VRINLLVARLHKGQFKVDYLLVRKGLKLIISHNSHTLSQAVPEYNQESLTQQTNRWHGKQTSLSQINLLACSIKKEENCSVVLCFVWFWF
jgi:hypothetical protein